MFFTLAGGLKPSKQTSHWGSPFQIWMKIKRFWNPASNFGLGVSYITYITSLFVNNPYEQNNDVLGTLQNLQRSHIGSMGTVEVGDPRGVAMRDFSLAGPNIANCATCPDHSPSALDRPRTTHLKVTFLQYCVPSQFQTGRFLDIWSLRPAPKMLLQGAQNFLSSWVRVQYLQIHMCPMCISKKELYPLKLRFWATLSTFSFVASCCTPDSRLAATFSPHLWHLDAHCEQSSLLCPSKIWPQDATGRTLEIADDSRNKATSPGSDAQNRRCLQPRIPQVKHLRIPGFFRCTNVQSSRQNQHHKNQLLAPQWDCWRLERHWRQWRTSPPPTVLLGMSNSAWKDWCVV